MAESKSEEHTAEPARYTFEYVKSLEGADYKKCVGERHTRHDISIKKWRLFIQLDDEAYWYLSVFFHDDGRFDTFSLDEEAADDSHYEFVDEEAIRRKLYKPGDEKLLFDAILSRFVSLAGGYSLLSVIRPYITAQFHYYSD